MGFKALLLHKDALPLDLEYCYVYDAQRGNPCIQVLHSFPWINCCNFLIATRLNVWKWRICSFTVTFVLRGDGVLFR